MQTIKSVIFIAIVIMNFIACQEEDKTITPYTLEPINKLTVLFTSIDSTQTVAFEFPVSKEVIYPKLKANTTYTTRVSVYQTSFDTIYNLTPIIEAKKEQHQFFYETNDATTLIEYADEDSNKQPIGLQTTFKTGTANELDLKIKLIHFPIKSAENVSDNNSANAGGSLDFVADYKISIE